MKEKKEFEEKKELKKKETTEVKVPINPEIEKIKADMRKKGQKKQYSFRFGKIEV